MKRLLLLPIAFVATLFFMSAHSHIMASVFHPASCEAINPGQSLEMQWKERGLVNLGNRSLWVMCPLDGDILTSPHELYDGDRHSSVIALGIANDSSSSIEIDCILRYKGVNGWASKREIEAVSAGGDDEILFIVENNWLNFSSIACKLPPGGTLLQSLILTEVPF